MSRKTYDDTTTTRNNPQSRLWVKYDDNNPPTGVGFYAIMNVKESDHVWTAEVTSNSSLKISCYQMLGWDQPTHYVYLEPKPDIDLVTAAWE